MADEIDRAQEREQLLHDANIAHVLAGAAALRVPSGARICVACEGPIEPARLRAVPAARHCAECARMDGES